MKRLEMKQWICAAIWLLVAASCGSNGKKAETNAEGPKPALMWFDAEANFARFSHKDSIDF